MIRNKTDYDLLLQSGMLFELEPNFVGKWETDKSFLELDYQLKCPFLINSLKGLFCKKDNSLCKRTSCDYMINVINELKK